MIQTEPHIFPRENERIEPRETVEPHHEKSIQPKVRAAALIAHYGLPVLQGRSDRDGKWYDILTQFPAALFDANGVLLIATEQDYNALVVSDGPGVISPRKDARDHTIRFPDGICKITGYMPFSDLHNKVWVNAHWRERADDLMAIALPATLQEIEFVREYLATAVDDPNVFVAIVLKRKQ